MDNQDKSGFRSVLKGAFEIYGSKLSAEGWELWWRMMAPYSIQQFKQAMTAHLAASVYSPKPADIIQAIKAQDGRPGSDEAWQLALQAMDEYATVVWTDEIAQAKSVADAIWQEGDKVGARMAFRQRYETLVSEARAAGTKPNWQPTMGFDKAGRLDAVQRAVDMGRLPANSPHLLRLQQVDETSNARIADAVKQIAG